MIDEVETLLRSRRDTRGKSLDGIRQILDAADQYPGLSWIFAGTPEIFDTRRGVAGLEPLDDRIRFQRSARFASPRRPQLELRPFDAPIPELALKLRELFPARDRARLEQKVTETWSCLGYLEWAEMMRDLRRVRLVDVEASGKRFRLRTETPGHAGRVFQACGVALPPTVEQVS